MVAAFASDYQLATLVGVKTAGRLVASGVMNVGYGYRVALPVAAYRTWQDRNVEGDGILPTVEEVFSPAAIQEGRDNQLEQARNLLYNVG